MSAWRTAAALLLVAASATCTPGERVSIGSKKFTESVILGELIRQLVAATGTATEHRRELGGTRVLWSALLAGEIDAYPEYTGTLRLELLDVDAGTPLGELRRRLSLQGLGLLGPLGFENTYALGMRRDRAEALGIATLSDLAAHPELPLGFTSEFMDRPDGWPGLRRAYGFTHSDVRGLDHDLAYRGLAEGSIAATDLYTTDADIAYYELRVLEDDRRHFPEYQAVLLYRLDLSERAPAAVEAMASLAGRISESEMIAMNARAKLERVPESEVAADFARRALRADIEPPRDGRWSAFLQHTAAHLSLVGISLGLAIVIAIPLGVLSAWSARLGRAVLGATGVIQTVPSLAMLVFMIPLLGIGAPPAIAALFLYSLLPIVRNTYQGLRDIPPELIESADVLGLSRGARLRLVELPLASRSILAGIQTSAVINVGTATLGALIGAGGYGQPILTGIRLDDPGLILQGAVPAAALALLVERSFDLVARWVVPRGLRLERNVD